MVILSDVYAFDARASFVVRGCVVGITTPSSGFEGFLFCLCACGVAMHRCIAGIILNHLAPQGVHLWTWTMSLASVADDSVGLITVLPDRCGIVLAIDGAPSPCTLDCTFLVYVYGRGRALIGVASMMMCCGREPMRVDA